MKIKEILNKHKKKIIVLIIILSIILGYICIFPYILKGFTNPKKVTNIELNNMFSTDYEIIRNRFLEHENTIDRKNISITSYPIDEEDNLYIDTMKIEADTEKKNLILITTGVHGIEGYVGAAMLEEFISDILPNLDSETTGIQMVLNVNPYGVKYGRRYNENNVDLNRNFIYDWESHDYDLNTEYPKVADFFESESEIGNMALHELGFLGELVGVALTQGVETVTNALLTGQYRYDTGVYYGGTEDEKSTKYLKQIFDEALTSGYENIIYVDIHTGYGQRDNMTIFNSVDDMRTEAETIADFNYETVLAQDSEEYYATVGDTTEYFITRSKEIAPNINTFATCFEFGTLGDDLFASILSLKYTVDENRNNFYPTESELTQEILDQRYLEMFAPTEEEWRQKAILDFEKAMNGMLDNKLI